ncbi:MAG: glycosyltransferase [Phycisphaerae bacterium]
MTLRNALLVTYQFPPIGGSGVQRAVGLTRHLPAAGWGVHVLCARDARHTLSDATLFDARSDATAVHRARGFEPAGLAARLCRPWARHDALSDRLRFVEDRIYWRLERACSQVRLPEPELLWCLSAVRAARRLIFDHELDAVVTTSPANATHLVGLKLKRRLGIPWVADLRDPIVTNFAYQPRSRWGDWLLHRLEATIVREADHVVVTCPELRSDLQRRYPGLPEERLTTITNGFDPDDAPAAAPTAAADRFVIAHVGAFYRQQTVGPILDAIRLLRRDRPDVVDRLELRLVGTLSAEQTRLVQSDDATFLRRRGYVTHAEAVAEMASASAVLLMTPVNERGRLCIPAKAFEYMAFAGHIIAIVHPGTALAGMLCDAGGVTLAQDHRPPAIARAIRDCFDQWQADTLEDTRDPAAVNRFRRDRLAKRFGDVISRCAGVTPRLRLAPTDSAAEDAA